MKQPPENPFEYEIQPRHKINNSETEGTGKEEGEEIVSHFEYRIKS